MQYDKRSSTLKRAFLYIGIFFAVSILVTIFFPSAFIIILPIMALGGTLIFYYLGYQLLQERSKKNRMQIQQQNTFPILSRIVVVLLIGAVVYGLLSIVIDNSQINVILTAIILAVSFGLQYYYAGKGFREDLERKKRERDEYIESLGTAEGQCPSCMKTIDDKAEFCPHCGYQRSSA